MKLNQILMGRSIQFGAISGPAGGPIYGWHLARHCQNRYGFLQSPQTLPDFDYERGVTFLHGIFHSIVVQRLQIFQNGIIAEAQAETDLTGDFINDLISSLIEAKIISISPEPQRNFYFSELEMISDIDLANAFQYFGKFCIHLNALVSSYGQEMPPFSFGGFALAAPGGIPWFKFENRTNAPPGVFYAAAPLRTRDHLVILEELEGLLTRTSAS